MKIKGLGYSELFVLIILILVRHKQLVLDDD
jgi:hypothetical protein